MEGREKRVEVDDRPCAERDERDLSEELARIDSCFRNARISAARGSMDGFSREHPHLASDPRWLQRLSSLERLEAELEEAELDAPAADRLLAEASGALERGDSEAAVRAARQALRAPDDARRERALVLLENSGGRLCAEKRKAASAATAKFQKSKAPEALEEAKNALRTCLELYPETAPNTVNNFISLVNAGFYNGLIFHRVIYGFMIQGGCPDGTGMGGPGYTIPGEFAMNGFQNTLKHTAGVLSMARAQHPDSAGSQFFIMHKDAPYLDGQYAAFGKIIEGMEVVNKIASVRTNFADKPLKPQVISSMTVDTQGKDYPEPEKA